MRILQVGEQVCGDEWAGVVRREDVRATEKDRVVIGEGFRVGDLVRGVVVSFVRFFIFRYLRGDRWLYLPSSQSFSPSLMGDGWR